MSKSGFEIVYKGPEVESGSMDVRALAPSLLSLGQLFEYANAVLNGNSASIQINVRANLKTGSFIVGIDVVQSLFDQAQRLLSAYEIRTASEIQCFIFGDGVTIAKGLLSLLKLLKGRPPSGTTISTVTNNIVVNIGDNNTVEVKPETMALFSEPSVRRAAYELVQPIKRGLVKAVEFRAKKKLIESVDETAIDYLAPPSEEPAGATITDETRTAALQIVRLSFEENTKWRFTDGNARFDAVMADPTFYSKVDHRDVAFRKGDVLLVKLRVITKPTASGGLRSEYRILLVLEHRPLPLQLSLQDDE